MTATTSQGDLFVTLADDGYLEQAKQLFWTAREAGGWRGDMMLLGHELSGEGLDWFRDRGILVRSYDALYDGRPGGCSPVITTKLRLFSSEFKAWRTVVYCDGDSIIRGPLNPLRKTQGFGAARDWSPNLWNQVVTPSDAAERGVDPEVCRNLVAELARDYDMAAPTFCAGFFALDTRLLSESTFGEIKGLMDHYEPVSLYSEQLVINLYFQRHWRELSPLYNLQLNSEAVNRWYLPSDRLPGFILHFIGALKPWDPSHPYHAEWREGRRRADELKAPSPNLVIAPPDDAPHRRLAAVLSGVDRVRARVRRAVDMDANAGWGAAS